MQLTDFDHSILIAASNIRPLTNIQIFPITAFPLIFYHIHIVHKKAFHFRLVMVLLRFLWFRVLVAET